MSNVFKNILVMEFEPLSGWMLEKISCLNAAYMLNDSEDGLERVNVIKSIKIWINMEVHFPYLYAMILEICFALFLHIWFIVAIAIVKSHRVHMKNDENFLHMSKAYKTDNCSLSFILIKIRIYDLTSNTQTTW